MGRVKAALRYGFDCVESALALAFPPAWNPLLNLGALGFFFYWIITVSGVYIFIFFDTGITQAYASIEYMTHDQWYAAGIMRSLHRYSSDGLVIVILLHIAREFALDRMRGVRWFSWVTGVPVLIMVFVAGISGYWLVWDRLAQYVAIVSTEWLDKLPFFGQPIARNFLSPDTLESRFFTLMTFLHIALPLIALFVLWLHLSRVSKPRINPPFGLIIGTGASLLVLALVFPATSQPPADLARVPGVVGLDWFYLPAFPLIETLSGPITWSAALALLIMMIAVPWLPPLKRAAVAQVNLDNCNGCGRCAEDCPYTAITMQLRSDGKPFEGEAVVDPSLCVSCGICAGACPTSTPFRRMSEMIPGIDVPDRSIAAMRSDVDAEGARLTGRGRVIVFGCINAARVEQLRSADVGVVSVNCSGQLPPAFIDYVLSRNIADGVVVAGCSENACRNRFGGAWTKERITRVRDPRLRTRVPDSRVETVWAGRLGIGRVRKVVSDLGKRVASATPLLRPRLADTRARETNDA
jgi:ferredoxin/coenzyme F420-reducing hydrogenase delta subunit